MKLAAIALILAFPVVARTSQEGPAATQPSLTDVEKETLARLIADLRSDDPKTLDEAFQQLAGMGPKAAGAIDALAGMLADDRKITYQNHRYRTLNRTFQVNVSAVGALRNIGQPAVPALVTPLGNRDSTVREHAAQSLAQIGEPIDPKHWVGALADSNKYVQVYAARELGKLKEPSAVEPLCGALRDDDLIVREEAAKALGQIGDKRAIGPLIAALANAQVNVSAGYQAGSALARIGRPAVEAVLKEFEKLDDRAKSAGAAAIAEADSAQMKDLLLECTGNKHPEIRSAAIQALAKPKTAGAFRVVQGMVRDPDWGVRWTAVHWLGEMADEKTAGEIRPLLLGLLAEDKEPKVREKALWALYYPKDKPPEDFWKTIRAAMDDPSPRVREAAATTAGKFWDARLGPALLKLLRDADPQVRAEAALVLGGRRVDGAIPELIRLLGGGDTYCAERAAWALGHEGTDKAVEVLIRTMQDTRLDVKLRNAAVYGLCHARNRKAIGPLTEALRDKTLTQHSICIRAAVRELTGQDPQETAK